MDFILVWITGVVPAQFRMAVFDGQSFEPVGKPGTIQVLAIGLAEDQPGVNIIFSVLQAKCCLLFFYLFKYCHQLPGYRQGGPGDSGEGTGP